MPTPAAEPSESVGTVVRKLGPTAWLGLFWAILPPLGSIALFAYLNTIGTWLRGHQTEGLLLYAAAFAVLAGFALLPTYASAILGGWAFGFAYGFPAALAGFTGGAVIGFLIARAVGKDRAMNLINQHPKWRVVRDALVGGAPGEAAAGIARPHWFRTTAMVALIRLPPNSPFALTNLVMSAAQVPLLPFIIGTVLGMAPRTALVVFLAAQTQGMLAQEVAEERQPRWLYFTGILVSVAVLLIIAFIANRAVRRATARYATSAR